MDSLEPVLLLTTIQNSDECGRCVIGVYLQLPGPSAGFTQGLTQLFGQGIATCPTHSVLFRSPISEVPRGHIDLLDWLDPIYQSLHPICNTGMRHLVGMVPCMCPRPLMSHPIRGSYPLWAFASIFLAPFCTQTSLLFSCLACQNIKWYFSTKLNSRMVRRLQLSNAVHFDMRLRYLAFPIKYFAMQGFSAFSFSEGCNSDHSITDPAHESLIFWTEFK